MKKAKQRYNLLKQTNQWGAKSPEQERIVALEAQLKNLKLADNLVKKLNKDNKQQQGRQDANVNANNRANEQVKKTKNKKDRSLEKAQKQDEEWKKQPPKDNEPKVRLVGKKNWHWCIHHMKWTVHNPEDCDLGKRNAKENNHQVKQATYAKTLAQIALMAVDE